MKIQGDIQNFDRNLNLTSLNAYYWIYYLFCLIFKDNCENSNPQNGLAKFIKTKDEIINNTLSRIFELIFNKIMRNDSSKNFIELINIFNNILDNMNIEKIFLDERVIEYFNGNEKENNINLNNINASSSQNYPYLAQYYTINPDWNFTNQNVFPNFNKNSVFVQPLDYLKGNNVNLLDNLRLSNASQPNIMMGKNSINNNLNWFENQDLVSTSFLELNETSNKANNDINNNFYSQESGHNFNPNNRINIRNDIYPGLIFSKGNDNIFPNSVFNYGNFYTSNNDDFNNLSIPKESNTWTANTNHVNFKNQNISAVNIPASFKNVNNINSNSSLIADFKTLNHNYKNFLNNNNSPIDSYNCSANMLDEVIKLIERDDPNLAMDKIQAFIEYYNKEIFPPICSKGNNSHDFDNYFYYPLNGTQNFKQYKNINSNNHQNRHQPIADVAELNHVNMNYNCNSNSLGDDSKVNHNVISTKNVEHDKNINSCYFNSDVDISNNLFQHKTFSTNLVENPFNSSILENHMNNVRQKSNSSKAYISQREKCESDLLKNKNIINAFNNICNLIQPQQIKNESNMTNNDLNSQHNMNNNQFNYSQSNQIQNIQPSINFNGNYINININQEFKGKDGKKNMKKKNIARSDSQSESSSHLNNGNPKIMYKPLDRKIKDLEQSDNYNTTTNNLLDDKSIMILNFIANNDPFLACQKSFSNFNNATGNNFIGNKRKQSNNINNIYSHKNNFEFSDFLNVKKKNLLDSDNKQNLCQSQNLQYDNDFNINSNKKFYSNISGSVQLHYGNINYNSNQNSCHANSESQMINEIASSSRKNSSKKEKFEKEKNQEIENNDILGNETSNIPKGTQLIKNTLNKNSYIHINNEPTHNDNSESNKHIIEKEKKRNSSSALKEANFKIDKVYEKNVHKLKSKNNSSTNIFNIEFLPKILKNHGNNHKNSETNINSNNLIANANPVINSINFFNDKHFKNDQLENDYFNNNLNNGNHNISNMKKKDVPFEITNLKKKKRSIPIDIHNLNIINEYNNLGNSSDSDSFSEKNETENIKDKSSRNLNNGNLEKISNLISHCVINKSNPNNNCNGNNSNNSQIDENMSKSAFKPINDLCYSVDKDKLFDDGGPEKISSKNQKNKHDDQTNNLKNKSTGNLQTFTRNKLQNINSSNNNGPNLTNNTIFNISKKICMSNVRSRLGDKILGCKRRKLSIDKLRKTNFKKMRKLSNIKNNNLLSPLEDLDMLDSALLEANENVLIFNKKILNKFLKNKNTYNIYTKNNFSSTYFNEELIDTALGITNRKYTAKALNNTNDKNKDNVAKRKISWNRLKSKGKKNVNDENKECALNIKNRIRVRKNKFPNYIYDSDLLNNKINKTSKSSSSNDLYKTANKKRNSATYFHIDHKNRNTEKSFKSSIKFLEKINNSTFNDLTNPLNAVYPYNMPIYNSHNKKIKKILKKRNLNDKGIVNKKRNEKSEDKRKKRENFDNYEREYIEDKINANKLEIEKYSEQFNSDLELALKDKVHHFMQQNFPVMYEIENYYMFIKKNKKNNKELLSEHVAKPQDEPDLNTEQKLQNYITQIKQTLENFKYKNHEQKVNFEALAKNNAKFYSLSCPHKNILIEQIKQNEKEKVKKSAKENNISLNNSENTNPSLSNPQKILDNSKLSETEKCQKIENKGKNNDLLYNVLEVNVEKHSINYVSHPEISTTEISALTKNYILNETDDGIVQIKLTEALVKNTATKGYSENNHNPNIMEDEIKDDENSNIRNKETNGNIVELDHKCETTKFDKDKNKNENPLKINCIWNSRLLNLKQGK